MKPQNANSWRHFPVPADGSPGDFATGLTRRTGIRQASLNAFAAILLLRAMRHIAQTQWGKRIHASEHKWPL